MTLNGIRLDVAQPREYLAALWHLVAAGQPDNAGLLSNIEQLLNGPPAARGANENRQLSRILGYHSEHLCHILEREWYDSAENECDEVLEFLARKSFFANAPSIYILGAGACRLGGHLACYDGVRVVTCSDLSWLVLDAGRAAIEGRVEEFPARVTRPRVQYSVNDSATGLNRTTKDSVFKPGVPAASRRKICFVVRDAFGGPTSLADPLIVLPYLLDHFAGAHMLTLLTRVIQQIGVGQEIAIIMTCLERKPAEQRDPEAVADLLVRSGFSMQLVDLAVLPYSFAYNGFGRVCTRWNTLIVRARRQRLIPDNRITVRPTSPRDGQREGESLAAMSPDAAMVLRLCPGAMSFEALTQIVRRRLDANQWNTVVSELTAQGALHLCLA